jgi:hypothetical protein
MHFPVQVLLIFFDFSRNRSNVDVCAYRFVWLGTSSLKNKCSKFWLHGVLWVNIDRLFGKDSPIDRLERVGGQIIFICFLR